MKGPKMADRTDIHMQLLVRNVRLTVSRNTRIISMRARAVDLSVFEVLSEWGPASWLQLVLSTHECESHQWNRYFGAAAIVHMLDLRIDFPDFCSSQEVCWQEAVRTTLPSYWSETGLATMPREIVQIILTDGVCS